jgi:hypothetical protein
LEALFALIATATETILAFEYAYVTFDAGMKTTTTPEPRLCFMLATGI